MTERTALTLLLSALVVLADSNGESSSKPPQDPPVPAPLLQIAGEGATVSSFNLPSGVAVGPFGRVHVADTSNDRISIHQPDGTLIREWSTQIDGFDLREPSTIAVGTNGNVFATSGDSQGRDVWQLSPTGALIARIPANPDPTISPQQPTGMAVGDAAGRLYVSDGGGFVHMYSTSPLSHLGRFAVTQPVDVAVGPDGLVYVAASGGSDLLSFNPDGTGETTVAGFIPSVECIAIDDVQNIYAGTSSPGLAKFAADGSFLWELNLGPTLTSIDVFGRGTLYFTRDGRDPVDKYGFPPEIHAVEDITPDQGGQLRVTWKRSHLDTGYLPEVIQGYTVYRKKPPGAPKSVEVGGFGSNRRSKLLEDWDVLVTVPARGDTTYSYVAPTLCDSTAAAGICWSTFLVSAEIELATFHDSPSDSGYSVDNIAPDVPKQFDVSYYTGGGNQLSWDAAPEVDFQSFHIYRDTDPDFVPGKATRVHTTVGTSWTDPSFDDGSVHYRVTTADDSGNESDPAQLAWPDVAGVAADASRSTGVSWPDFDGDGDEDLYVVNFSNIAPSDGPNRLYENSGGTFIDVTPPTFSAERPFASGTWADMDNDGDVDLFQVEAGSLPNRLFRNDTGTFVNVTSSPLDAVAGSVIGLWVDVDQDGFVDLYVVESGSPNVLYRNLDGATFDDVTPGPLADTAASSGGAWADSDGDGDPDLYLSLAGAPNRLLRNDGGNVFVDVTTPPLDDAGGLGATWVDYNNDGRFDLFLAGASGGHHVFRNDGGNSFAQSVTFSDPINASMGTWADVDLDGDLDVYLIGGPSQENRLFRNDGSDTFADATSSLLNDSRWGRAAMFADVDLDGDPDAYLANRDGHNRLFRNPALGRHWIQVELQGTASNRSAIGATVSVLAAGQWQHRQISGGQGFHAQPPLVVSFGLDQAVTVDSLEVRWPSGTVDALTGQAVDQRIMVVESGPVPVPEKPRSFALHPAVPNPFNPSTTIGFDVPGSASVSLGVYDIGGRLVRALMSAELRHAGHHRVLWDGRDSSGRRVASGIYLVRMNAGEFAETRRLTLLK